MMALVLVAMYNLDHSALQDPEALHKYNAIFQEVNGRDFVFRLAVK